MDMDIELGLEVADEAVFVKTGKHLSEAEVTVLRGAWQGQTYDQIAEAHNYSAKYLRQHIGASLWKLLSQALDEEVSKTNFRFALQRKIKEKVVQTPSSQISSLQSSDNYQSRKIQESQIEAPKESLSKEPPLTGVSSLSPASRSSTPTLSAASAHPHVDWGEAIDVSIFYSNDATKCPFGWLIFTYVVREGCMYPLGL